MARALENLPRTVHLFSIGELSYAKVRAISRVATPENEDLLVMYAKEATAAQLERIVQGYRRANELGNENEAHKSRSVEWHSDGDGAHVLTIRMTAEQRALVRKAQEVALAGVPAGTPEAAAAVDAFVLMAETVLANGTKRAKDRHLVNLNVDADVLADDADGGCNLDGLDIAPETARRLSSMPRWLCRWWMHTESF